MRCASVFTLALLILSGGMAHSAVAGDWPAFRGPAGDGTSDETGLPIEWGRDKNVKWRAPLAAPGNSSPIVVGGKVFITLAEDQGHKRHLLCFDRENGESLWTQTVHYDETAPTHQTNPYSGSTPVSDGERVIVYHGSAGMYCYDMEGNPLWDADLGKITHIWGFGSSPIIHDGRVIQLVGPGAVTKLVALDLESGEIEWETPEPGGSDSDGGRYIGTWATPLVTRIDGRDQLLMGLPTRVGAYDPTNGKLVWWVDGLASDRSDLCYTSALRVDDVGVIMGGFGGPSMGFKLGGEGDMTEANRLWRNFSTSPRPPQRIGTGVVADGMIYMANADNQGSIECIDPRTGEQRWEERRTDGGPHWGSMIFADGRIYVTGQQGVTHVLAPNPDKYEVLAENDLGERSNSTPAISNGQIFLRTFDALYCIDKQ
jgi:outer membrane protein assembly factor BamB